LDCDHRRHRPDEHEARGDQKPYPRRDPDEQQRDERPEADRQADVGDGEDDRPEERVPEDGVVEDAAVVVQPDADPVVLQQLEQPVLLEREPDEVVDRIAEDRPDDEDDRGEEEIRNGRAPDASAGDAPPPRPPGGVRGGGSQRGGKPFAQGATSR
jgi:hypothetical protein